MTALWDVPFKLKHMLSDFEVYGMQGHPTFKQRYNLLLDDISYELRDDARFIHGTPTCCEGATRELYMHGCFPRFPDKQFGDKVTVMCDEIPPYQPSDSKVLLWNVADSRWYGFSQTKSTGLDF